MSLLNQHIISKDCLWGIWQLTESESDLLHLVGEGIDKNELLTIKNQQRRVEWLGARALLFSLAEAIGLAKNQCFICKDEQGKPFMKNASFHISFSHCKEYAVAILHRKQAVGIDLEQVSPQIARVIHRVCTEEELAWAGGSLEKQTVLWCAKEALYKCYGKKKLDFKKEISVKEEAENSTLVGEINKEKEVYSLKLEAITFNNYKIAYCF